MKFVRMMAVRNEIDVLPQNIEWYAAHGIRTVVVDNGSDDGSYEYCRGALARGEIELLERVTTPEFEWLTLLSRLHAEARALDPDWLMLTAADEFFETASGENLMDALRRDIVAGYNLFKFYNMEFWMTDEDDRDDPDPLTRMRHYSCYDVGMDRMYPNLPGLDIVSKYGHRAIFPDDVTVRRAPRLYVSRHYKLRNLEQARRKVRRIRPNSKEPHLHTHYAGFNDDRDFFVPAARLHRYEFDHRWRFDSTFDGRRGKPVITRLPGGTVDRSVAGNVG